MDATFGRAEFAYVIARDMATPAVMSRDVRTSSNTSHHDALVEAKRLRLSELETELIRVRTTHDEQLRRLMTPPVVKTVSAIRDRFRRAFDDSLAATIGEPNKMAEAKDDARGRMDAEIRREVKCYNEIRELQQQYSATWQAIAAKHFSSDDSLVVHAGDWLPTVDVIDEQVFGPPFDLTFASAEGLALNPDAHQGISDDSSSTDRTLGFMSNDITATGSNKWDEAANLVIAISDLALGVRYTAPKAGVLNVGFTVRNLYSRLHGSLTNHWGFSNGDLLMTHSLEAVVGRAATPVIFAGSQAVTRVKWIDLSGDDATFNAPEIPAGPITLVAQLDGPPLEAGEQVEVLAGCNTGILSHIDNMGFVAAAAVWWQVESLRVFLTD
jgi:hypothetical protein